MGQMSFEPLTPTAFLRRAATVHRDRLAVIDGAQRWTYGELWDRCLRLAGGLARSAADGARIGVLSANSHLMLECHYGVPLAGQVLVALNTRLSADELAYIIDHAGVSVLIADAELGALARDVAAASTARLDVVGEGEEYERLLSGDRVDRPPHDERALLAINYTSGTTGRPKGVMYHHRGAYLQALAMALHLELRADTVFLWTLPMFHCNGWCLTWGVTAVGGVHRCLRRVDPELIWRTIREDGVTHLNAAPTVLSSLAYHPDAVAPADGRRVRVGTGGAPPSPTLLGRLDTVGIDTVHLYGLTESFGPVMVCDWHPEWDALPGPQRAELKARQGVGNVIAVNPRVVDSAGEDVPADGQTVGEVVLRGNDLMLGYYKDPEATDAAQIDGWFRTGDLGAQHEDGYVELRDRRKDVIISGGENISSVEVEQAVGSHPAVLEVAVIAIPDERWGERPAAYVVFKPDQHATGDEIAAHVRTTLAGFKVPDRFVAVDGLPKTSTGKIKKFELRAQAWQGHDRTIA